MLSLTLTCLHLVEGVKDEIVAVLKGAGAHREGELCVQAIFLLLDVLKKWAEETKGTAAWSASGGGTPHVCGLLVVKFVAEAGSAPEEERELLTRPCVTSPQIVVMFVAEASSASEEERRLLARPCATSAHIVDWLWSLLLQKPAVHLNSNMMSTGKSVLHLLMAGHLEGGQGASCSPVSESCIWAVLGTHHQRLLDLRTAHKTFLI